MSSLYYALLLLSFATPYYYTTPTVWRVFVSVGGKDVAVGAFDDEEEAAHAYVSFGEEGDEERGGRRRCLLSMLLDSSIYT